MITSELISYIKKQIKNNIPKDLIISKLIGAGWHGGDVEEGFLTVESEPKTEDTYSTVVRNEIPDKYREPAVEDNSVKIESKLSKVETPKNYNPTNIQPRENLSSNIKVETPSIPVKVPEEPIKKDDSLLGELKKTSNSDKSFSDVKTNLPKKDDELIPTLKPKVPVDHVTTNYYIPTNVSTIKDSPVKPTTPILSDINQKPAVRDLSKIVMLSSYKTDSLSVNKEKEETIKNKTGSKNKIKWIIIAIVVCIVAFFVWAFASGFINIKNINIPFIKKDPKVLLLNNSEVLSSLESYKTETDIKISSPTIANISAGLTSGEAISSLDKDYVSINTVGMVSQKEQKLLSDNFVTVKSSLLQNYITTDIKGSDSDLFISVSDLDQIINENVSDSSLIKISEEQSNLIPSLFSTNIATRLEKINTYKILSKGVFSFINKENLASYNELISNATITEKSQEKIKGTDTYHYSIAPDKQSVKKFLSEMVNSFSSNLSEDDQNRLSEILGSTEVYSFEIWIGKSDNNIYQFNLVFNVPLSKIIGFEDKSIGDSAVNIVWKTTFYDFDIDNSISIPTEFVSMTDFVENVKTTEIKNNVSSFKQLATDLFNDEGNYGSKSNTSGSCMSPTSGSLFSPTGHIAGASTAVSEISSLLNSILGTTKGTGYCYSTPKAWSFTIPISSNYDLASIPVEGLGSFFCIDSTGDARDLTSPTTSVVCAPKIETTETAKTITPSGTTKTTE